MEQSNFSKIVNVLRIAYPYYFKDMEKESTIMFNQLYYSKLKRYDYVVVSSAINKIIEKSEFMPTIAEILTECDKETRRLYKIKMRALASQYLTLIAMNLLSLMAKSTILCKAYLNFLLL